MTALHRCACVDNLQVAKIILKHGAAIDAVTSLGQTALHLSAQYGAVNVWKLLVEQGANWNSVHDCHGDTPASLAAKHGWTVSPKQPSLLQSKDNNNATKTGIVTNPLCLAHHTCPRAALGTDNAPPENVKRLHVLMDPERGVLLGSDLSSRLRWTHHKGKAPMIDVLRVHEYSYVRQVQQKCDQITSHDPDADDGIGYLDGDTTICSNTFNAALAAAGAVCEAVDQVMRKEVDNAFCPIRPPGHHAGPLGVVKNKEGGGDSHGFCILNNISIAAAYAMNRYRETVKKVAIVDFDVHHGNGTEETVRWLTPRLHTIPIVNDIFFGEVMAPQYKPWYDAEDAKNVLFVSVHGYGPRARGMESMFPMAAFYPGTGRTALPPVADTCATNNGRVVDNEDREDEEDSEISDNEPADETKRMDAGDGDEDDEDSEDDEDYQEGAGDEDGDRGSSEGEEEMVVHMPEDYRPSTGRINELRQTFSSAASHHAAAAMKPLILDVGVSLPAVDWNDDAVSVAGGKPIKEFEYRVQWRNYFRNEIFPRLMTFQPDFLFISAGFDAHKKDTINAGYISLIEEDYEWVTSHLVAIANSCCDGRVVSALEGGYQLGGEHYSAFAKSVKTHVAALARSGKHMKYDAAAVAREGQVEAEMIRMMEEKRNEELRQMEEAEEARRVAAMNEYLAMQEAAAAVSSSEAVTEEVTESVVVQQESMPVDESGSRKRRRPQVDYQALDKEMREKERREI